MNTRECPTKPKFKIPEEVKPGSAEMVWHNMQKQIKINEDVAGKARQAGNPDTRLEDLIKSQKMQQTISENITMESWERLEKNGKNHEEARQILTNFTPGEMHDLVQKQIEHYQKLQGEDVEDVCLQEGHNNKQYPVETLLKAAEKLQSRLLNEESKDDKS